MTKRLTLIGLFGIVPGAVFAQGTVPAFDLFEEVEQSADNDRPVRRQNAGSVLSSEPEFTLVGTSRIGSKYTAMLKHRGGDTLVLDVDPAVNSRIPGFIGYSLVNVGAGTVSIRYPDDIACVESSQHGVSCNDEVNTAALTLVNGEPRPSPVRRGGVDGESSSGDDAEAEQVAEEPGESTNPFAALRANAEAGVNATQNPPAGNRRFTPRRIAPEDVPPGMRVVSTPFGDRLVEQ